MNKRQSRIFAIVATGLAVVAFLGLTLHSHTRFGELTNAQDLTPEISHGKDVWHKYNCINCHTLFGEGAYYAPDLTKITQQRGEAYLKAYMRDPSKFYDEQRHRRLMPTQNLSELEIDNLIKFLDWVSKVDNQGWPPRPIVVSSGGMAGATAGTPPTTGTTSDEPVALGEALFRQPELACQACHSVQPGVTLAGPSMAGIGTRAAQTVADPAYTGSATDAEGYLREAIVDPSAHLVPGANFGTGGDEGLSLMPADYGTRLDDEQIDYLVVYLSTLR